MSKPKMALALPAVLETHLQQHVTAEMLKYHAGQQIFCPGCEQVLDWRDSVSIDFIGQQSGKLHSTKILCGRCADRLLPGIGDRLTEAATKAKEPIQVTTTDGRDWSGEDGEEIYDPPPALELGAPVAFKAARPHDTSETVQAEPINKGLPDYVRAVVYFEPKSEHWYCCDWSTGFALASADSKKGAVVTAFRRLRTVGREKFEKCAKAQPVLNV